MAIRPLLIVWILLITWTADVLAISGIGELYSLIGQKDSLLVANPEDRIIISKNERKKLVPASILKLFTALNSLHYLGSDFRFQTEFYIDNAANLIIKGFGDPLLISEIIDDISRTLAKIKGSPGIYNDLIVDDSYFNEPLTIPGVSTSSQPYDAPNGAMCANFNTVFFKSTKSGYISAEPQTPLLPYAIRKIGARKLKSGRIVLSHAKKENTIYAGKLFQYFLMQQGVAFKGTVKMGRVAKGSNKLIYKYFCRFSLEQIISRLLEYSNNFITNQLLITAGARALGPPGNLHKGVKAALQYAGNVLQIDDMKIVEGSGISRKNRISARHMQRILEKFEPYYLLMPTEGREYYKTGTLSGISTRAGYIDAGNGRRYRYVIMINTPGKSTKPIVRRLLQILD
jgi:D-alanyl-D-alanine carboxypeptidase/D-alanyl-D-alanine-endopeptidase (penicillin-binding protein 4)